MNKEIQALENNNTCNIMLLPPNKKPIGSKWVYKVNIHSNGTSERYKTRLVAKVNNQIYGIYYVDSFSPVAKVVTVRIQLALSISKGWFLYQIDINNSFLHDFFWRSVFTSTTRLQQGQGRRSV